MAAKGVGLQEPHTCAPVAFLIRGICKDGRYHEALALGPATLLPGLVYLLLRNPRS